MSPALLARFRKEKIQKSGTKILVVTGSSGGHIFPAISFLNSLKAEDTEGLLVLPRKSIRFNLDQSHFKVKYICVIPLRGIGGFFKFIIACFESLGVLLRFNPDVAISFGSLSGIPIIILARIMGIKTLLQEQNVIPGKANKFLAGFADKVCLGFRESAVYFSKDPRKLVFTGNPIRAELEVLEKGKALDHFGFKGGRITILVVGGSQGSRRINSGFIRAVSRASWKGRIQVIHIAGPDELDLVNAGYAGSGVINKALAFLNEMSYAYSSADLVICRAGAITISELIHYRLPAIIIPYPFAHQHQKANASVLERNNCALVIEDNDLDKENILERALGGLLNSGDKLIRMRAGYDNFTVQDSNGLLKQAALN